MVRGLTLGGCIPGEGDWKGEGVRGLSCWDGGRLEKPGNWDKSLCCGLVCDGGPGQGASGDCIL